MTLPEVTSQAESCMITICTNRV